MSNGNDKILALIEMVHEQNTSQCKDIKDLTKSVASIETHIKLLPCKEHAADIKKNTHFRREAVAIAGVVSMMITLAIAIVL